MSYLRPSNIYYYFFLKKRPALISLKLFKYFFPWYFISSCNQTTIKNNFQKLFLSSRESELFYEELNIQKIVKILYRYTYQMDTISTLVWKLYFIIFFVVKFFANWTCVSHEHSNRIHSLLNFLIKPFT